MAGNDLERIEDLGLHVGPVTADGCLGNAEARGTLAVREADRQGSQHLEAGKAQPGDVASPNGEELFEGHRGHEVTPRCAASVVYHRATTICVNRVQNSPVCNTEVGQAGEGVLHCTSV